MRDIYLTDDSGTTVMKITNSMYPSRLGAWSPDARSLVYCSLLPDAQGATWQIHTVDLGGGGGPQLTSGGGSKSGPAFSPQGDSITYLQDGSLMIMDNEGHGIREIHTGVDSVRPPVQWDLDGRVIFFHGIHQGRSDIYRVKPDGSEQFNLTRNGPPGSHPAILPDRKQLAYVADLTWRKAVYLMDLDGFSQRPLSHLTVEELGPVGRRPQ
jgi:TolB protein